MVSPMIVKVSSKGQIVLPAGVRRRMGIESGDELVLVEWGDAVYLVPKPEDPIHEARGILKRLGSNYSVEQFLVERKREEERRDRHLLGLPDE